MMMVLAVGASLTVGWSETAEAGNAEGSFLICVSINGNAANYVSRPMPLNNANGAFPYDFITHIENQAGAGATLTVVDAKYITSYLNTV